MEIIDAHMHVLDPGWVPLRVREAWARAAAAGRVDATTERLLPRVLKRHADPDAEVTVKAFDSCGVSFGIAQIVDWTLLGEGGGEHLEIRELHQHYEHLATTHENRLYYSAGIDPRHKHAKASLEAAVDESHCVGIKLYPAAGWDIDDPSFDFLFDLARTRSLPLVVHTSPLGGSPLSTENSRPSRLARRMAAYPDVIFVMAHAGFEAWWIEAADIASGFGNAVVDISLWSQLADRDPIEFRKRMAVLIEKVSPLRILFGSDDFRGKGHDPEGKDLSRWIDQCQDLAAGYRGEKPVLAEEAMEWLMCGNATRVFMSPDS